jgi:ABC-type multidrug transport system fused ATPase/permease subunit
MVGVSFAGDGGRNEILRDYTVRFETGQRTALVGNVGSGKTTILRLLLGLYTPTTGDVYYDGLWYSQSDLSRVRRAIGYIPQHPMLFDSTVLENVLYGSEDRVSPAEAVAMLEETGLLLQLSQGADTNVGKGGQRLSGGQRQMVWCIRVLLQNPPVLVMDEPTASMDSASARDAVSA